MQGHGHKPYGIYQACPSDLEQISTHHISGSMFPNRNNAPLNTRFLSCNFGEIMPCDGLMPFEYSCDFWDCCCSYINPLCFFQGCSVGDDGMETTGGTGGHKCKELLLNT